MGREVRMVPRGWQHPKNDDGKFIPLLDGNFAQADADWNEGYAAWQRGEVENYSPGGPKWKPKEQSALDCASYTEWNGERPSPDDYMPTFPEGTATMLMMYEDTSEGTPISPAFETPEELARWLADTGASAFGGMTATYEQWLATCRRGGSIGMVMQGGRMMSGVEFEGSQCPQVNEEAK
jgi:hypothetical protein